MANTLIRRMRKGFAVYWPPDSASDNFGKPKYLDPIEIRVRWEDRIDEHIEKEGRQWVSRSRIFTSVETIVGGFLWRGKLADVQDTSNPLNNEGAYEIKKSTNTPTLDYRDFVYVAFLAVSTAR